MTPRRTIPRQQAARRRAGSLLAAATLTVTSLVGCGAPGLPGAGGPGANPGGAVTEDQAGRILHRVLEADAKARSGRPDAGTSLASIYAGEGLVAAKAAVQLIAAGVQDKSTGVPAQVDVLATSRGTDYPRYLLGASRAAPDRLPVIHLLVATKPDTPYRLALSAQLLPGAQVSAFPSRDEGTQVVTDGADMAVAPVDLLKAYAAGLTSKQDNPPYQPDTFGDQVLSRAEEQKKAVATQADFTQTTLVRPDPVVAFREANGDTLVLGAIERISDYAIKPGQQMAPTPVFSALVPNRTVLVQQVRTQVSQFLVFTVPRQGKAALVAATEQVSGASGY